MSDNSHAWHVYLAGEIHSDWRQQIEAGVGERGLSVCFSSPVTDHAASDEVGVSILGEEASSFWKDHKAARINAIRIRRAIETADVVVVRFGPKYKQWNAAFDAGYAAALGKPIITLHDAEHDHALKEINVVASATCREPGQVVDVLAYVLTQG